MPYNGARFAWDCDESWVWSSGTEHNGDLHGVSNNGGCVVAGCSYQSGGLVLESKVCAFTGGGEGGSTTGWDDFWTNTDTNGGTGSTGNTDPIVSSPTVPTTGQLLAVDLGNLLGITDQEILVWIEFQPNWFKAGKLKDFIEDNNCGLESGNQNSAPCQDVYDFAEDILMIMMGDPDIRYNEAFMMAEVNDCLGMEVYLSVETIEDVHGYLIIESGCSEEAQEFTIYAINVLNANPDTNPFLSADCRSFEYSLPPGALQRGCAVTDFNHTFYTVGIRPNGSPYYGEVDSNIPIIYFTASNWMTNGQAANATAAAVTLAVQATDIYFAANPDVSETAIGYYFRDMLIAEMSIIGGSVSTTYEPFPIPSPAPYITSVVGLSNPYDCD